MSALPSIPLPPASDESPDTSRVAAWHQREDDEAPLTQRSSRLGVIASRESVAPSVEIVDRSGVRAAVAHEALSIVDDAAWLDDAWLDDVLTDDGLPPDTEREAPPTMRSAE